MAMSKEKYLAVKAELRKKEQKKNEFEVLKIGLKAIAKEFAHKIAPIYTLLNWKWNGIGIPNEDEVYEFIINLINRIDSTSVLYSSGGILIEKEYDDSGELTGLSLSMLISETLYLEELK